MLAASSHPLVFHVPRNGIQEDLFHSLSGIRGEADWPINHLFFQSLEIPILLITITFEIEH